MIYNVFELLFYLALDGIFYGFESDVFYQK